MLSDTLPLMPAMNVFIMWCECVWSLYVVDVRSVCGPVWSSYVVDVRSVCGPGLGTSATQVCPGSV